MIEAALSMAKVQFAHNRWANERLLESLRAMPPEAYTTTPCSGNGPIASTVAHLLLVQQSWITFLSGSASLAEAIDIVRNSSPMPDPSAARARWKDIDEQTSAYLDSLTDEAFVTEVPFSLPSGLNSSLPRWEMLLQITSHGVHTRGQIISAIRSTGTKPAEVSFLSFCMENRTASVAVADDEEEA